MSRVSFHIVAHDDLLSFVQQLLMQSTLSAADNDDIARRCSASPQMQIRQHREDSGGAMAYGKFVGRVGGLAAALGIGIAIASLPVSASADTGASTSSESESSANREMSREASREARRERVTSKSEEASSITNSSSDAPNTVSRRPAAGRLNRDAGDRDLNDVVAASEEEGSEPQDVDAVSSTPPALGSKNDSKDSDEIASIDLAPKPRTPSGAATRTGDVPGAALRPSSIPDPQTPADSAVALAVLASARRPVSSAETREHAPIGDPSVVYAVPNTQPTISSISARAPGLFTGNVTGRVRATDADRDKLSYTATASQGTVKINSMGSYTYTPSAAARHAAARAGAQDQDTVTVTVTDGYGGVATTYIGVMIRPKNTNPTAKATVGKGNPANGVVTGQIVGSDKDGDSVSYSVAETTVRGSVTMTADGTFVYTPTTDAREAATSLFRRSDRFTVLVDDGHGGVKKLSVRVGIVPPGKNSAPTVGNPSYTITNVSSGDGTVTGYVSMADPDGFGLTFSVAGGIDPAVGTLAVNAATGSFTFTPTTQARENAHGTAGEDFVRFTIAGSDGLDRTTVEVSAVITPKAPPPPPPPPPPTTRMRWPLASVQVNRYFGGNGHNGIDLNASINPKTPVYAAADGVISFEGYGQNHSWMTWQAGICVLVWHPALNVYSGYAHLSSTVINNGQTVARGQLIGYAGSTGNSSGPHLHFEVLPRTPNFSNGYSGRIDPLPYLR